MKIKKRYVILMIFIFVEMMFFLSRRMNQNCEDFIRSAEKEIHHQISINTEYYNKLALENIDEVKRLFYRRDCDSRVEYGYRYLQEDDYVYLFDKSVFRQSNYSKGTFNNKYICEGYNREVLEENGRTYQVIYGEIVDKFGIQRVYFLNTDSIINYARKKFMVSMHPILINLLIYLIVFLVYIYEGYFMNDESGMKNYLAFDFFYRRKINSEKLNRKALIVSIVNFDVICEKRSMKKCFGMIKRFLIMNTKIKCIYLRKGTFLFLSKNQNEYWIGFFEEFSDLILNKKKSAKILYSEIKFDVDIDPGDIKELDEYIKYHDLGVVSQISMNAVIHYGEREKNIGRILDECLEYSEKSIIPYFQPLYSVKDESITRYEVLMRFKYKDEVLAPYPFICFAEKHGLISVLDMQLYEAFFKKLTRDSSEFSKYKYSINLSGIELNERFIDELVKKLKCYDIPESLITLEITETSAYDFNDNFVRYLKKLQNKGFKIAIDDFGSGFSNFNLLRVLDVDFVKIDGSLVRHVLDDEKARKRLQCIINMLKLESVKIVAEFVESKELRDELEKMGANYLQGYYIGRPDKKLVD